VDRVAACGAPLIYHSFSYGFPPLEEKSVKRLRFLMSTPGDVVRFLLDMTLLCSLPARAGFFFSSVRRLSAPFSVSPVSRSLLPRTSGPTPSRFFCLLPPLFMEYESTPVPTE